LPLFDDASVDITDGNNIASICITGHVFMPGNRCPLSCKNLEKRPGSTIRRLPGLAHSGPDTNLNPAGSHLHFTGILTPLPVCFIILIFNLDLIHPVHGAEECRVS